MQKAPDFFHQARGFFLQGQLGWVVLPRPLFKSSWLMPCVWRQTRFQDRSHWSKMLHVQVKSHSFSFRKGKIPVVTVVIMNDLLSGKCSTVKVHMFSTTSTLWPSFLGSYVFSLSPQSQSKSDTNLGFQSATIWGPRHRGQMGGWSHEWRWSGEIPQATLLHK